MTDEPDFEVVTPVATAAARRLTTPAAVRALIGSPEADDDVIATIIDAVSADCVAYCKLARGDRYIPTFGQEIVRATWPATTCERGQKLALPWRVPVDSLAITEDGATLDDAEFRLLSGSMVQRRSGGYATCWSSGVIVATWIAGWPLEDYEIYASEQPPPDLISQVIEQVKIRYLSRGEDTRLRSENLADIWAGTYNVAGGDAISSSGLLRSLESALEPYRRFSVA